MRWRTESLLDVGELLNALGEQLDTEAGMVLEGLYRYMDPAGPDFGMVNMFGPNPEDRYPTDEEIAILDFPF
ncbi:MAG TPA: hypothetical protein VD735_02520 [Candidatus Saccharimonadales bacterium]|nr:hypothetical protein [Candidatus Saccharimonadales bacterium]